MKKTVTLFLTVFFLLIANITAFSAPTVDLRSEITRRGIEIRNQGRGTCVLEALSFLQEYALTGIFGSTYNHVSIEYAIQAGNRATGSQNEDSNYTKYNKGYNAYGTILDSQWPYDPNAVYNYNTWDAIFANWIDTGKLMLQDGYRLAGKCLREGNEGAVTVAQIEEIIGYLDRGIPVAYANAGHATALVGYERDNSAGGGYFIYRNSWGPYFGEAGYSTYIFGDIMAASNNVAFFVYEIALAFPTVYQDINYKGYSAALAPGKYTLTQLSNTGIANDDLSSIKVPSGYTVYLYQDDNFSGTVKTISSSINDFSSISFDNMISSINIVKSTAIESPLTYLANSPVNTQQNLGTTLAPRMTKDFTIEMWVNPGNTQQTYANILDFNHRANVGMVFQQDGNNLNNFGFGMGNGSTSAGIIYQLQTGVWQHIAFEREGTALRLYSNGKLVATAPCFAEDIYYLPGSAVTVQHNINYGRYFNGAIKGLKFWNYAKSATSLLAESNTQTIFDFNGSTDGIMMGNALASRMAKNFSMTMWIKPGSTQQTYADIIDFNHRGNIGMVIQQDGNNVNNYVFAIANGSTTSYIVYQLKANTWQSVKFERIGTTLNLYVDNVVVATTPCFAEDIYFLPDSNVTLGYNANYGRYFNGSIMSLRFNFY
jgi:hypothetical protein